MTPKTDSLSTRPAGTRETPVAAGSRTMDGLPTPRRHWAMFAIAAGVVMSVIDASIANVALPSIAASLHAAPAASVWVVNGYQLSAAVALLPCAAAGERIGYARIFKGGLIVFLIGSLACALSTSLTELIASRIVQGLGGAGLMSVNGALVRHTFPGRLLGRGVGFNAMAVSLAAAAGPSLSSAILAVASWPWLFAINLPIGLINLLVARRALPDDEPSGHAFDWVSAGLNAILIGVGFTALGGLTTRSGAGAGLALAGIGIAAAAAVALARRERAVEKPIIPFDLFRDRTFTASVLTAICAFAAYMLLFVALPFHLQGAMGRSQVVTGLLMTPFPVAVGLCAPLAGRLADRHAPGAMVALGMLVFAAALAPMAYLNRSISDLGVGLDMALAGAGFGLFQTPNNRTLLLAAPRSRAGAAGGMVAMARLIGMIVGAGAAAIILRLSAGREGAALALASALAVAAALAGGLGPARTAFGYLRRSRGSTSRS